jgi:hypothetical protein
MCEDFRPRRVLGQSQRAGELLGHHRNTRARARQSATRQRSAAGLRSGSLQPPCPVTFGDRVHLDVPDLGTVRPTHEGGHVASENAVVDCPLERHMDHGVDVMYGDRTEAGAQLRRVQPAQVTRLKGARAASGPGRSGAGGGGHSGRSRRRSVASRPRQAQRPSPASTSQTSGVGRSQASAKQLRGNADQADRGLRGCSWSPLRRL